MVRNNYYVICISRQTLIVASTTPITHNIALQSNRMNDRDDGGGDG